MKIRQLMVGVAALAVGTGFAGQGHGSLAEGVWRKKWHKKRNLI